MFRMHALLVLLLSCAGQLATSYTLVDTYNVDTWQSSMRLETQTYNSEYVKYLTLPAATDSGLISNRNGKLFVGVDSSTVLDPNSGIGRNGIRLRTNKGYNAGTLVIGDFAHIPLNVCGIWPAFWMVGPSWPQDGEIDIMEGVNQNPLNQMTLHTQPGCVPTMRGTGSPTGSSDCGANGGSVGCGAFNNNGNGWGYNFNAAGGGVYAMEWTAGSISVWFFQAGQVPGDISNGAPNPGAWGTPVVQWTGCNFASIMDNMSIIINTAFCGNWAGGVWSSGSCASLASQCYQYVAANPGAFSEAYWLINSIKVYQ